MLDEITLSKPEVVELCNWLMEAGRRLDKAEPHFSTVFLVLAPGSRVISFLPQNLMHLLLNNLATVQGVIEARTNYLDELNDHITSAESLLKRINGVTDTSVN